MRRFVFLLILIAFLTGTATTEAANWVQVGSSDFGSVYIDTSSITTGPDGSKEAWFKQELQPANCSLPYPKYVGKCASRVLFYERFYPNKTHCKTENSWYFIDGTNDSFSYSCSPQRIRPGTVGEGQWNYLFR